MITKSDPSKVVVEWADGERSEFGAKELRDGCPCARCVDEMSGRRTHDPRTTDAGIRTEEVHLVGLYALGIRFSDGHDTGIYPFPMLRDRRWDRRAD
ncbi:MAG: DUF971 domain-containing protein [Planctomycetota bacterium]